MRISSLCALAVCLVSLSCTRGSGVEATEVRSVSAFEALDVGGPLTAAVRVGASTTVEVVGDDNLVSKVRTELVGDTLHVALEGSVSTSLPMLVRIETPALRELDAEGASTVSVEGIDAERFEVDVDGASTVELSGTVVELSAEVSGASKLRAQGLAARSAQVEADGASKAEVEVAESLEAEAGGASTIRYHGNPESVSRDASGASKIEPAG